VLAHESGLGIIEDDKLEWFIYPSVAKTELDALVGRSHPTMPQTTRELDDVGGFLCVKADDESRGVNGVNDVGVAGVGT